MRYLFLIVLLFICQNIIQFIENGGFNHNLLKNLFFIDLSIFTLLWLMKKKKVQHKLEEYFKIITKDLKKV